MDKNIKLPFMMNKSGGAKSSFKILTENEINEKASKNKNIITFIKRMLDINNKNKNINYIKASDSQKYYRKLKKIKK